MFGKERVRRVGSELGDQTGNGLRDSFLIVCQRCGITGYATDFSLTIGSPGKTRILLGDQIPIQSPVLNRFGEVGRLDIFLAFEVSNGSSYL